MVLALLSQTPTVSELSRPLSGAELFHARASSAPVPAREERVNPRTATRRKRLANASQTAHTFQDQRAPNAPPARSVKEVRSRTLAFRLTESERQAADALAGRAGLKPSEFARQAVLEGVTMSVRALELAREEAGVEMGAELDAARAELDRVNSLYASLQSRAISLEGAARELATTRPQLDEMVRAAAFWQVKTKTLEEELRRAPEDLVDAIRSLINGDPGARATVARLWSAIPAYPYPDREKILPIVAAHVADAVELIVTKFSGSAEAFALWPISKGRIEWLFDGLRLDAGEGIRQGGDGPDRNWRPVIDAVRRADAERRRYEPDFHDT